MSSGRVQLGLGAGWLSEEHEAHAIPFPDLGERFDRFEEQRVVITGLWSTPVGETFDHACPRYPFSNSPTLPKAVRETDELRANGVAGTPGQARETLERWHAPGAELVHLQVLDVADLEHLDLIATTLA